MATSGPLDVDYHKYGSEYTGEQSTPGYYTNTLTRYGIRTEVSATERTSIERYTFRAGQANILINLGEASRTNPELRSARSATPKSKARNSWEPSATTRKRYSRSTS